MTPGAGPFLLQGHNLNKLGRGAIDNATHQISRLCALWFHAGIFSFFSPIYAYIKHVTPRPVHV